MLVLGLADHLRCFCIHDVRCAELSYQPFCFSQCHQCCVSPFVREVQAIAYFWISSHQSSLSSLCSSSFIAAAKNLMPQIQASNVKMIHATVFSMLLFPFLYKNSGFAAKKDLRFSRLYFLLQRKLVVTQVEGKLAVVVVKLFKGLSSREF